MDSGVGSQRKSDPFLEMIFDQLLWISRGDTKIDQDLIESYDDPSKQNILNGLFMLHEDLELYKKELRSSIEDEYKLKVLEERNKELERFTYVASHDLQEPLNTIKNFVNLLKETLGDNLNEESDLYLNFIVQSTGRMSDLIFGLLNYSKAGNDSSFEMIQTDCVVKDVLQDLYAKIHNSEAEVLVGALPSMIANKLSMRQIFQNLIGNGIKFIPPGKKPIIKVEYIELEDAHQFSIEDNGIGIKKEDKEKVFKIFQRLHTKTAYKGTGIGLSVCQKIVDIHEGKIWLESEYEKGTTFFFTISKHLEI